jgi:C-terminal peptidase prc
MWDKIRSESEDSSFEGIGAMLRGGGYQSVIVETPLANSPALRSGLRAGDIIRKVDGKSIDGLSLSEVVKRIRGPKETIVTLGIERPPVMTAHDISITRGVISQKAVSSEFLPDENVGVIKVSSFLYNGTETSEMVREEYQDLKAKSGGDLNGLVIDLRNNPGGFLDESIKVAGLFLKRGSVVVQTRGRGTGLRPRKTYDRPIVSEELPIIVLVNAGSASASEIVASALMDHNRALVLGERSFGKASVQEMQPNNSNGIIVKLTTARYYAPRGYTIQVYGVEPDIKVSDELDGTFPPRFREEDMWKHLPELTRREQDPTRESWVKSIAVKVGDNTKAEAYIKSHKHDARRPDFMLIRALGYMKAMKGNPTP